VLQAYGASDKGRVRSVNEDFWAFEPSCGLCVVADGMGGHKAGDIASRLAVETIVEFMRDGDSETWPFGFDPTLSAVGNRLRTAVHLAHMQILETAVTSDQYAGMGTTIVACTVDGDRLSVAHAGDSRLYLLSADGLRQITHDDSWAAAMAAHNPADRDRYAQHPMRGALTNVIGARQRTDVHVIEETLTGGELLVLTTDGVHGMLEGEHLEHVVLGGSGDVRGLAENLVAAALARGGHDNCTALVARYLPGTQDPS
jgi:serine/threonine protein phosphatase PrpC